MHVDDLITLLLITGISVISGIVYWLHYLIQSEREEPVEIEPLGEYAETPVYSQGVLDFYKRIIQEWVVVQFAGWKNVHKLNFSNRDHFRKLTAQILLDFFEKYSLQENVRFKYCLFSEDYLVNYISMVAMETMSRLVENEIESMEEK